MVSTLIRWFLLGIVALGTVGACLPSAPPSTPPPAPSPTTETLYESNRDQVVTTSTEYLATSERLQASATPSHHSWSQEEAGAMEAGLRYDVILKLDYSSKVANIEQVVHYRNATGQPLESLVFYVEPNKQSGIFSLDSVTYLQDSSSASATLEGVRLKIELETPLLPGCTTELTLTYQIDIPPMGSGHFPRQGYLGHTSRQLNLGSWAATLAYRLDGEWITSPPINVGEQTVTPAADYDVTLELVNAPDDLVVVGPGHVTASPGSWHYVLPQARDFVLTLSTEYQQLSETGANGTRLELYTLPDVQNATGNASAHAMDTAITAFELFSDLYGPYPYNRLVIVEGAFPDGMEFTGLVFVGGEWFRLFDGDPASYLTLITAHEIAHQWWYARVANDQSREPWLDEALSTYSEYIYLQEYYPDLADWWWAFRVDGYSPQGYVDSTVYEFSTARAYINAVYLRGAQLLHAIRQNIGGETFFQWLSDYASQMNGKIATAADLWGALPDHLQEQTAGIRTAFLRYPNFR